MRAALGHACRAARRPAGTLAVAAAVAAAVGLAACTGQRDGLPQTARQATATGTAGAGATGTTVQVDGAIDVIGARVPAPPARSATAQAEMTLASTTGPDVLLRAVSPAARAIAFTSDGRRIPRLTIPVAEGSSLTIGPPYPDRILLTGLRHPLRIGQAVTITFTFAHAGRATLQVPVTPPVT